MEMTDSAMTSAGPTLTHEEIVSDLTAVLSKLNTNTPTEIAHFLKDNGIRGSIREAQSCPIANYLRKECAWIDQVIVAPNHISAYPANGMYADPDRPTALNGHAFENIENFIANFDQGAYPFLLTQE